MYMFRCMHKHYSMQTYAPCSTKPKCVTHTRSQADELDYFSRVATSIPISVTRSGTILNQIEKRMADIQYLCNDCNDCNKLQRVHHLLGTVLEQFLHNTHNNPSRKRKPSHMMSKTQPRFYSTKKKRKVQDKAIDKPSQTEIAATQTTLDECETDIIMWYLLL